MRCSYALVIFLCAAGCTKGICSRNSECAIGFVCSPYGTCTVAPDANTGMGSGATPSVDAATADPQDTIVEPVIDGDL